MITEPTPSTDAICEIQLNDPDIASMWRVLASGKLRLIHQTILLNVKNEFPSTKTTFLWKFVCPDQSSVAVPYIGPYVFRNAENTDREFDNKNE